MGMMFTACEKEDVLNSDTKTKKDILTFKSIEEFNNTLAKVNAMPELERLEWERQQGFKSFGTICDEFYETIEPKKFKSIEEIKSFVSANNDKIQFYENPNGDTYCVTNEFKNLERYILNKDRMYIIGTEAFKKYNEGLVVSDISNIDKLKSAKNYDELDASIGIKSIQKSSPIQKASNANVTNADAYNDKVIKGPGWGDDDTYRLHVWISTELGGSGTKHFSMLCIKNFYRALGIWFFKPDVFVSYNLSSTIRDSYGNSHPFSYANPSLRITSSNNWPTFYQDFPCNPISSPYFSTYNVTATNTITDSDGTCHCSISMNY